MRSSQQLSLEQFKWRFRLYAAHSVEQTRASEHLHLSMLSTMYRPCNYSLIKNGSKIEILSLLASCIGLAKEPCLCNTMRTSP
jgi:hypothetical protein